MYRGTGRSRIPPIPCASRPVMLPGRSGVASLDGQLSDLQVPRAAEVELDLEDAPHACDERHPSVGPGVPDRTLDVVAVQVHLLADRAADAQDDVSDLLDRELLETAGDAVLADQERQGGRLGRAGGRARGRSRDKADGEQQNRERAHWTTSFVRVTTPRRAQRRGGARPRWSNESGAQASLVAGSAAGIEPGRSRRIGAGANVRAAASAARRRSRATRKARMPTGTCAASPAYTGASKTAPAGRPATTRSTVSWARNASGGRNANGQAASLPCRRPVSRSTNAIATRPTQRARNCGANARYPWIRASCRAAPTSA